MNNNTIKQAPIINNYITVLIETLHKTSNKKGHITISEVHSQRILKHNINTNHGDRKDNDSNDMMTWYGRLIKKLDRLLCRFLILLVKS